jgi:hypothetical protein
MSNQLAENFVILASVETSRERHQMQTRRDIGEFVKFVGIIGIIALISTVAASFICRSSVVSAMPASIGHSGGNGPGVTGLAAAHARMTTHS